MDALARPKRRKPAWRRWKRRLKRLTGVERIFVFALDLTAFSLPRNIRPDLSVRRATLEEWDQLARNPAFEISPYEHQDSRRIMAEGDQLLVGEIDGQIVSFHFIRFNCFDAAGGIRVDLPADTVYAFRGTVPKSLRSKGVASTAMAHITDIMKQAGYRRLVFEVYPQNIAQRRAVTKIGSQRLGTYFNFRFLKSNKGRMRRRLNQMIAGPREAPAD